MSVSNIDGYSRAKAQSIFAVNDGRSFGPRFADTAFPDVAPTITVSTTGSGSAGATSPLSSPLNMATNGLGYNGSSFSSGHWVLRNGYFGGANVSSNTYYRNNIESDGSTPEFSFECDFWGSTFAVKLNNQVAGPNGTGLMLEVNGEITAPQPTFSDISSTTNQPYWWTVTFSDVRWRRIRGWMNTADFGGISYQVGSMMFPPTDSRKTMAIYGDSWVGGALGVGGYALHGWLLPKFLGFDGYRIGSGSTGYTTGGPVNLNRHPYTDATRLGRIAAVAPDYIYIHGSQNDDGASSATMQAAATSVYSQLATLTPNSKIILHLPPRINATMPASRISNNAALIAAATIAPNVIGAIDDYTDTVYGSGGSILKAATGISWITGTGTTASPAQDGTTADVLVGSDGAHRSAAGHQYYARREVSLIRQIIAAAS